MEELIAFGAKIVELNPTCKKYKKGNITITIFDNFMIKSRVDSYYTNLSILPKNKVVTVNIFELFNFLEEIDQNLIIPNVFDRSDFNDTDHLYRSQEIHFRFNYEPLKDINLDKDYILSYNHIFIKIRNGWAVDTYYISITDFNRLHIIMSIYPKLFINQPINREMVDITGYKLIDKNKDNISIMKNDIIIKLGKNYTIFGLFTNLSKIEKKSYINVDINIMINFISHIHRRIIMKDYFRETNNSLIYRNVEFTFVYDDIRSLGEDDFSDDDDGEEELLRYCLAKGIEYEPRNKYKNFTSGTTKIGFNNIIMKIRKSYMNNDVFCMTTRILFNMEDYNKVNRVMDLYPDIFTK
jgi:hypothetical protein